MWTTLLLAFVQSMTEFLPVSSSGHLFLVSALGISHNGLAMDVALHLGTLLAVVIYFYKDIWNMLLFKNLRLTLLLAWATLPIVIVGLCFGHLIEHIARKPIQVAVCSIVFGILLWIIDKKSQSTNTFKQINFKSAFIIGCSQIIALIPGVSRSGITMTTARALKINRSDAAHFSMLLSIPAILGAMTYVIYKNITGDIVLPSAFELQTGIISAAFFGWLVIAFLMKWLKHASFAIFAIYRIILGLAVLIYFM